MKHHVFYKHKKKSSLIISLFTFSILCISSSTLTIPKISKNTSYFEDNSENNKNLSFFFKHIDSIQSNNATVRIAFFGDSFIEGDILTGELRKLLQARFGGNGVGFVPIASQTSGFRSTLKHQHRNITSYNVVFNRQLNLPFATGGYYFTPKINNSVNYTLHKPVHKIRLFYQASIPSSIIYSTNTIKDKKIVIPPSKSLANYTFSERNLKSIQLKLSNEKSISFYGLSFEDTVGIILDNFGLRSNSGVGIGKITDSKHREFDSLQSYNLIVLQYGLNATSQNQKNFSSYQKKMSSLIERLKKNYPTALIVLFSVSDRCVLQNGKLGTMNSIPLMVETQRKIARQSGIVFWNLFQAMGGTNSIIKFARSKPSLAAGDYTHLTHKGGEYIARLFYNDLLLEYERLKSIKKEEN